MNSKEHFYFKRTYEHIQRVQNNMLTVVTQFKEKLGLTTEDCRVLSYEVFKHDRSKFSPEQFEPYLEFSWHMKTKEPMPEGMQERFDEAWRHHYCNENHHTQSVPIEIQYGYGHYDKYRVIETVCDMQAMAQEFNEGTCRKYFETKWKLKEAMFLTPAQRDQVLPLMDEVIKCFEHQVETQEALKEYNQSLGGL